MIISYAQHYEDIILAALLDDVERGFYVDVGANDPVNDSVTNYFYKRGWRGVNIEPMPSLFKKLQSSRKRDTNLNLGIADKKGMLTLREIGWQRHGLSTFKPTNKIPDYLPYKEYKVPVVTLTQALKGVKHIDFLKIDVEGMEYEVLKGYDWKVKPEVILIEDNFAEKWLPIIKKNGYKEVCFDGLNRYFVQSGSARGLTGFQDLLNLEVIPLQQHKLRKENKSLQHKSDLLAGQLDNLDRVHSTLVSEHHNLQTYPENFFAIRRLFGAAMKRSLRKIKG